MWDEQTKLPIPPLHTVAPADVSFWATAIFSGLAAIVFLYGLKHWRDTGRPIVLMMMIGGAVTVFVEPVLDIIGAAWHPEIGQNVAFELVGRQIPWWVVAVYVFYFGALGSLNYLAFEKGVSMKVVWIWFSAPVLVDIVMEELMMHWDLYWYYGNQPLIAFFKFPLWWAPCNSIGEFIGVSLLVLMGPALRGWKLLLIPIILPVSDFVGYAAVSLPAVFVVNTEGLPWWLIQLGGVGTFALCALVVYALSLVIATDSPIRIGRREGPAASVPPRLRVVSAT